MQAKADTLAALRRGDLAGARELRLPGGLAEFPREIFGLADTLEVLDLGPGSLTDLPADLGRLARLRVLFGSGNRFARLPPALGDCAALSQIGCRGSGIAEVPAESLPPRLRWLTLTDNRIAALPRAIGERPLLRKLMLSGNRLAALPESLAGAPDLELLRIAANRLDTLPGWIAALPALAWLACAGNPCEPASAAGSATRVPWSAIETGALLGEGASGRVHAALWRRDDDRDGAGRAVALKLFKGAMTSDGLPEREMTACLTAGAHPHLSGGLGRVVGHPEGLEGLLMPLLPAGWRALAGPPSLASCSRDIYAPGLALAPAVGLRLARAAVAGTAHLHAGGLIHGDIYAHNLLWDGTSGDAVLSDFGAASVLPAGAAGEALQRIETRALGILLDEILDRCRPAPPAVAELRALAQACRQPDPAGRPRAAELLGALDRAMSQAEPDAEPDTAAGR
ncbi:leucine-rich repeat-containing protein kinase family protein [Methylobacterium symbioticum]|uniref:Protein kinase domain-containing protein n=1 Tax=Methylobacterium symbioticum TaxID=2584084 RepID=A0A509EFB8_9HYPH|nr:leucine-rich repeat-containing protein kinase family protein [Methylobacterium symbioticum]VUD73086.1 hypothetical protein MET9862_03699 [Methylobacterium symbioticum]